MGQLLRLTRLFDNTEISILALSVDGGIDCAIVRLLVTDPDAAVRMLREARFAVTETDVIVVELPPGKRGILTVCAALIAGEVNVNYTYALLTRGGRGNCLAIQVDNPAQATTVLTGRKFRVLDQHEL